ncbi:MAG: NTP transferase domain-containing protein [Deltaproteobacteria bacterium]|nr:NTP transferase domain-containing protein [Deltaproteobacteria bacterium]
MKTVILAGGRGTRLAPYTTVFPKPMLPIDDKPILEIIIKQLAYFGFKDIVLSVGYLAELIQAYFQNNHRLPKDVNVTYIREGEPLGTAGSLSLVPDLTETFLVMNGDVLTTLDYSKLMGFHKKNKGIVTIAMHKRQVKIDFGVISTNGKDELTDYDEKPTLDYSVSMGVYVFEPKALAYVAPGKKLDFPDLIKVLLAKGEKVCGYSNSDYWLDIGRHDDYEEAVKSFKSMERLFLKQS